MKKIVLNSDIPLYQQIKNFVIKNINDNEWKANEQIPTELELENHFKVSRTTIRQAITELIDEKYLYRKKGIGTFVNDIDKQMINNGNHFMTINTSELIKINSLSPSKKIIEIKKINADKTILSTLMLSPGEEVFKIIRIQYGNGVPLSYTITYIAEKYLQRAEEDINQIEKNFHKYLSECGYPIQSVEYKISAVNVTDINILNTLNIDCNSANLYLENISKDSTGTIIEVSKTIINSRLISIPVLCQY